MDSAELRECLSQLTGRRCIFKDGPLFMTVQIRSVDISDWGVIFHLMPEVTWTEHERAERPFDVSAGWDLFTCEDSHVCTKYIGWELNADPEIIESVEAMGRRQIKGKDRVYALLAAFRGHGDRFS